MQIQLAHASLRSFRMQDVDAIARHANNRKVWRNLLDRFPHPYTPAHAREWIHVASQAVPQTHFAIEVDGEAAGGIGLQLKDDVFRRSAEIGYWLGEPFWNRGIATEAVRAIVQHGFTVFDLCRIFAGVFEWNLASMRVLEKAGFVFEGRHRKSVTKDGCTVDQIVYAVVR